jgi:two-component system chemotaxis sensor kinase CheA
MAKQDDAFLKRLLETFRIEADEHLRTMSSELLELEKMPPGDQYAEIIERVFREAHSLKGAARAVNSRDIESVCQALESVFAGLKSNRLAVSPALFDLLYQTLDALGRFVAPNADTPACRQPLVATLIQGLDDAFQGRYAKSAAAQTMVSVQQPPAEPIVPSMRPPAPSLASQTVRISTQKLDAVMRQVDELLTPRLASAQRAKELREAVTAVAARKKERRRIQPAVRLIERSFKRDGTPNDTAREQPELMKLLTYLDTEQLFMNALEERLIKLNRSAECDQRTLAGMTDSLLRDVKEMHMLPFASLLEILPRLTRDLARDRGKEAELRILGDTVEIDRRILEEMKDPLIHLLRNCVDHGIETPKIRQDKGKSAQAAITIAITQKDSGKIEIQVADDGAGIDADKVRATASKLGIISPDAAETLSEHEAQALIFRSGLSTSPVITDVSGRGLGLAIVREKVERLGGVISLESHPADGTIFRIVLPLTLAHLRGVLVRCGEHLFIIPATSVERVLQVAEEDIRTVQNRETIPFGGEAVSLVWLSDVLELSRKGETGKAAKASVIVLCLHPVRIAFRVEAILGEQDVLVKSLGPQLARVRNVGGACVLGTGRVVPVLNVPDLLQSAVKSAPSPRAAVSAERPGEAEKRSILVVEDSITSRALLKNILESAGYHVVTAVDGIDAYTVLKTATFDLVVSDVEMPRMDGFDLTARIRADRQFAELPVVLVTALESREHRERGIDVGANAYVVKSSFDQSDLLEVVRRLI